MGHRSKSDIYGFSFFQKQLEKLLNRYPIILAASPASFVANPLRQDLYPKVNMFLCWITGT